MLLVAGGQLDPNIGAFLRQCLARGVRFRDVLLGPQIRPRIAYDLDGRFELNGERLEVSACFVRHDVFLAQRTHSSEDSRACLNWFHAVRDWSIASADVRVLNRYSRTSDQGKYGVLARARAHGLTIPATVVSTDPGRDAFAGGIRKPVAGGELTQLCSPSDAPLPHPYFLQPRLLRPELRVYRIGERYLGFGIASPDLDYRSEHNVSLQHEAVPDEVAGPLGHLCTEMGLDFAAADFMRDEHGAWVFLEINAQPMFAAFDRICSGGISNAIIDWLTE